jgi:3-hydroxy-5-phosphonooxypentane-2,4-dione thiolase
MFNEMHWGKKNRMSQIIQSDGRALMLAIDHGYFMGPTRGMEVPAVALAPLLDHADSLMLSPGILGTSVPVSFKGGRVLRASGGNSILDEDMSNEAVILSARQAVTLNASAVAISIYVGAEYQHQTLMNLAHAIEDASEYGLPVLGVTAVGKEMKEKAADKRFLALSCRIAAELGADLVKTYYCDGFEEVVTKTPVPIVIAGGPKLDTYQDILELCHGALERGAVGVDMGRNIWQSEHPAAIIQGVRGIVHDGLDVAEALDLVNSLASDATRRKEYFAAHPDDARVQAKH